MSQDITGRVHEEDLTEFVLDAWPIDNPDIPTPGRELLDSVGAECKTYSPDTVVMMFKGIPITGYASGNFVAVRRDGTTADMNRRWRGQVTFRTSDTYIHEGAPFIVPEGTSRRQQIRLAARARKNRRGW